MGRPKWRRGSAAVSPGSFRIVQPLSSERPPGHQRSEHHVGHLDLRLDPRDAFSRVTRNATSRCGRRTATRSCTRAYLMGFRIAVDSSEEPDVITGDQWFQPSRTHPTDRCCSSRASNPRRDGTSGSYRRKNLDRNPSSKTAANESFPVFAPGGGWLAYHSDLDGGLSCLCKPYPRTGERFRASADPGEDPVWSPDGTELFYRDLYGQMMAVPIQTAPKFSAGHPVNCSMGAT